MALLAAPALATPVAQTQEERELLGRVFQEPMESTDYIKFAHPALGSEFIGGMQLLQDTYPDLLEFATLAEITGDETAVSVGPDGLPAWDPADSGDGNPLYVATVTDESVPDEGKAYTALMFSHSAEPCGREAVTRMVEDLLIGYDDDSITFTDYTGTTGTQHEYTAKELLQRTKIYVLYTSPDGWASGDLNAAGYSQDTGAGFNSNRIAYQTGWVFPDIPEMYDNGYTVATQPAGIAFTTWLREIRETELDGAPFATAADIHGPVPFGMILLHDQGNSPQKLERVWDLGNRVKQAMDTVFEGYVTQAGADAYAQAASGAESVRQELSGFTTLEGAESTTSQANSVPLQWATVSHIWDLLSYTASATWGGWANSDAGGLGADSLSYEINCVVGAPWEPARMQLHVDNAKSIALTTVVAAAAQATEGRVPTQIDLGGTVAFFDDGARVTDADGNPSPPPQGYPGTPLLEQLQQVPYDVSNTDYFRDLRALVTSPIVERGPGGLADLRGVDTVVVADRVPTGDDAAHLRSFVEDGGNLVLTDAALQLLPELDLVPADAVSQGHAYVGYADFVRDHEWVEHLAPNARQTFDPIAIGYELLMERDGYWSSDADSTTANSSPIWMVDRTAWEEIGGEVIGTSDPSDDPKGTEGRDTDRVSVGRAAVGDGRVVVIGALLPQPSEDYPHWFGLDAYGISVPGQKLFLQAAAWGQGSGAVEGLGDEAPAEGSTSSLPATGSEGRLMLLGLLAVGAAALARTWRRHGQPG